MIEGPTREVNRQHGLDCSLLNKPTRFVRQKWRFFMKGKKEDRRIGRTRKMMHEALMALIVEKGYESVTVQDILDRADLGRSTFYSHYRSKDELLLSGFDHLRTMLEETVSKADDCQKRGKRDRL
jgi:hypothetical protein